jgi:hypothetical protein
MIHRIVIRKVHWQSEEQITPYRVHLVAVECVVDLQEVVEDAA